LILAGTLLALTVASGCNAPPPTTPAAPVRPGLSAPRAEASVRAMVAPPEGWVAQPLKSSRSHDHQIWLSPSGSTAYGVICFRLPFPLPADFLVRPFLSEMRRTEGDAELLERASDPELPGVRFVAAGGRYVVRTNLLSQGWQAWAIYAGTLRNQPIEPQELELAELARESTRIGLPAP
jgi:hypothetical protein